MLFPARMLFVTIGVHREHARSLIESLHEAGLLEIKSVHEGPGENAAALLPGERGEEISSLAELRMRIDRILGIFERANPRERSMLSEMLSVDEVTPQPVPEVPLVELKRQIEEFIRKGERALAIWQELTALEDRADLLERERGAAELLIPFGIDIDHLGASAYLWIAAGTLPASDVIVLHEALKGIGTDGLLVYHSTKGDVATLLIAAESALRERVERVLRTVMWEPIQLPPLTGAPEALIARNTEEIKQLQERISSLKTEMEALSSEIGPPLRGFMEELEIRMREEEAFSLTGSTQETVVIEGYLKAGDRVALESLMQSVAGGCAFCRFQENETVMREVPTAYRHPSWLRPFQMLTSMFAVPRYGEIDPTILIAPLIVAYFGIMLGDAGYGMIISILALFMLQRFASGESTLCDLSRILLLCGISGIVFGLLQGGFFGDLLPRFFGVQLPFMLIDPLASPVAILMIALLIGAVQLNLGLLLGVIQHAREGRFREAIEDRAVWFILQPSAIVLVLEFLGWQRFPAEVQILSWCGALLSLGLLLHAYGPLGFFRITNFLGDWLSYTRILALDLATLGIAMTINILSEMIASLHPFAVPIAILFAILGHVFNLVLQTLGGMIHALRLQYVEFFGKFYTGGGRPFSPFRSLRRYSYRVRGSTDG